jgi:hypothetical protein
MKTKILLTLFLFVTLNLGAQVKISAELKKWHSIYFDFSGPETSENDSFNPFTNYRLDVTFTHKASGKKYLVPGFFAADGNAANTSAAKGNTWRVIFTPDETGPWAYTVSFRKGEMIAVSDDPLAGNTGKFMDKLKGKFKVLPGDKVGKDFRAKGRLEYTGEHYLKGI